jgi:nitrate reductase gamma subunit
MDLLGFARGPALRFSLVVFAVGVTWRIAAFVLLRMHRNEARPRTSWARAVVAGLVSIGTRSWPHRAFIGRTGAGEALGYSYHFGLFIVVLLFTPHILLIGSLIGLTWPGMPSGAITAVAVLTITLLLAVLFRRLTHPVLRLLSNVDDYLSCFLTLLVLATGVAATAHLGGPYQTLLAIHILSFDALLLWFPFGKLMHAFFIFPGRALNGTLMARKGAAS